jgi:hypothetical protein
MFLKMGPFIIDWQKPGIASLRTACVSHMCAIIDLQRMISCEDLEQLKKIMKVWNKFYGYSSEFSAEEARKKKAGNQYAFLNTILNVLGYKKWWSRRGEIGNYLKNIKTCNCGGYPFFKGKLLEHDDVDQYYRDNKKLCKEELELLRAFDRAFRNYAVETTTCPFINLPEREAKGPPETYILNTSPENEEFIYKNSKALKDFI